MPTHLNPPTTYYSTGLTKSAVIAENFALQTGRSEKVEHTRPKKTILADQRSLTQQNLQEHSARAELKEITNTKFISC